METWRDRTAQQWVQSLSEGEPEAKSSVPNLSAIALLSSQIEAEHARHAQRLRRRRWSVLGATGLVSAAAALAFLFGGKALSKPSSLAEVRAFEREVTLEGAPIDVRLSVGRKLAAGDAIVTGEGAKAALALADGGSLELGAFSELRLLATQAGARLTGARLGRGSVSVTLNPLPQGESFSVTTPDTKVTVVGTTFDVRVVEAPEGPMTCVKVSHGRVRVETTERQALLQAGESWASRGDLTACGAAAPVWTDAPKDETPSKEGAVPAAIPSVGLARGAPPPDATGAERKNGTLAEENRLFLELVRARSDGRLEQAKALQRKFLRSYPSSALAAQVREEERQTK